MARLSFQSYARALSIPLRHIIFHNLSLKDRAQKIMSEYIFSSQFQ